MEHLSDKEQTDLKDEKFHLYLTLYKKVGKLCVNTKTDTDKLGVVVYRYQNNVYIKGDETYLKLTFYEKFLAKTSLYVVIHWLVSQAVPCPG